MPLDVIFTGTNFNKDVTSVNVGSRIAVNSLTILSSTRLMAKITVTGNASTGVQNFVVSNNPVGGGIPFVFTVTNPAPTLQSIAPVSGLRGQTVTVTVAGSNFIDGATTLNLEAGERQIRFAVEVSEGVVTGKFSNTENALLISYGKTLHPALALGAGVKLLRHDLAERRASGIGYDLGVLFKPSEVFALGGSWQNLRTQIRRDDPNRRRETFLPRQRIGAQIKPAPSFQVSVDYEMAARQPGKLHVGGEVFFGSFAGLRLGNDGGAMTFGASVLAHASRQNFSIDYGLRRDLVVAWRIFHLTKLGREVPNVPCTIFFEEAEWKALVADKTQNPVPPENPPTLREALHMVASLGGFLGRQNDGEPGTKSLWLGLQRLEDMTAMWKITMATASRPSHARPVSSEKLVGYG